MPSKKLTEFNEVVRDHRARLDRLVDRRGAARLKRIYDQAYQETALELRRKLKTGLGDTYTAFQHRVVLAQLKAGQGLLAARLKGEMVDLSKEAQTEAIRAFAKDVARLEKTFTGATIQLPIDEAHKLHQLVTKRRTQLDDMHQKSIARWGVRTFQSVHEELAKSLIMGQTVSEAIEQIPEAAAGEWWQGERIVRCLPGETLVTGAVVRAAYRRWYDGDLVEVITASGNHLSTTPNHPMLTQRGWVLQGGIMEGDYLVRHRWDQGFGPPRNQDVDRRPATVAEVFDSVSAVGVQERRGGADPDFHGDGLDGEVDVARVDRQLVYGVFSPLTKPTAEQLFSPTNLRRQRFCARCQALLPYERACFCQGSDAHAHAAEASTYNAMINAVRRSYLWAPFSSLVSAFNLVQRQWEKTSSSALGISSLLRLSLASRGASLLEVPFNAVPSYPQLERDEARAKPAFVELDRVTHVRRRQFSGHVYNLSTRNGYFAINGYYTGNTETAYAFNAAHHDSFQEAAKELDDLRMRWTELVSDTTGQPLDERVAVDSLALHGQLSVDGYFTVPEESDIPDAKGKTEVPEGLAGQRVAFPPNRPNDRATLAPWRSHWGIPAWEYRGGSRVEL